ncbi:patatin-like phospholipase family protein [Ancylobacter sp. MQZ15Z-1]|uniref:Patatin-like phospholipase family protein n=1 Tax=Ancylobacter mangrovi TaxID=2972472 RepID=A0A9X2PCQ2_9HYPH|nr:patatin-like phospholipase family protein [Ancylobacter mangrovi]MCS0493698.1 patatin-like phospholipase family protein [Ancylobacter mangrovi]
MPAPAPAAATSGEAWDDGLAHPIPYTPPLGTGKERGLVLGGGGAYLASWMVGYFRALHDKGVDLALADIVVGTSAGSFLGAVLTGGHLWRFGEELEFFGKFPKAFAELIPTMAPNESQLRARHIANTAVEADPATIQAIGRGAMAARNAAGPDSYFDSVKHLIGEEAWPSPKLHTTANDCYTGERLIVSQDSGIEVNHACAASSSLPGSMGPTWLKNRLCMDGGICQTSTHCDVVTGVKKALVISLTDGDASASKVGLRTSSLPNTLQQEIADLKAGGTQVVLKVAGLLPGVTHVDSIMDPKWISPCIANGHERGLADAAELKDFWGTA